MAIFKVFSGILNGFLEVTGNTLGMNTSTSLSIQNKSIAGATIPNGTLTTTADWVNASSSAVLEGNPGATVAYAVLCWAGGNVQGTGNQAITFSTPTETTTYTPDPTMSQAVNGGLFIQKATVITDFVQRNGATKYTLKGIPVGANWAGWFMVVVWQDLTQPVRLMQINLADELLGVGSSYTFTLTNFFTPTTGTANGRFLLSVGSCESDESNNYVYSGPTAGSLVTLSGPNNPVNHFFGSQINFGNSISPNVGLVNTNSTYGNNNATQGVSPTSLVRWHFDITNVPLNPALTNSQTQLVTQVGPGGNGWLLHLMGLQIDVKAPSYSPFIKSVDKASAYPGDTITYTAYFQNSGNNSSISTVFQDTIPSGTTFVSNSLAVNGTTIPGANPQTGYNLGAVAINAGNTVTFQVTVNSTIPNSTILPNTSNVNYTYVPSTGVTLTNTATSNSVNTLVLGKAILNSTKSTNSYAKVGTVLTYTIPISNSGTATALNVVISDTIPVGTTFVPGSLKQDGNSVSGSPNPPGTTLPNSIGVNKTSTVTFQVTVVTIPTINPILNYATQIFTYTIDSSTIPNIVGTGSSNTNVASTQVNNARFNISKSVDKYNVACGDSITYTIVMPNTGNVTAQNIIFYDTIPNGTVFINNSVTVDGVTISGANPQSGVTIPNLAPGSSSTVTFSVTVQC